MAIKLSLLVTVFCVVFIAGLKLAAATDRMFYVGTIYDGKLSYYAGVSEEPLSWRGQQRYCSSKHMMKPVMLNRDQNRILHDRLHDAMLSQNLTSVEQKFWMSGWRDATTCQYAYFTRHWMGSAWADCTAEVMDIAICMKKN